LAFVAVMVGAKHVSTGGACSAFDWRCMTIAECQSSAIAVASMRVPLSGLGQCLSRVVQHKTGCVVHSECRLVEKPWIFRLAMCVDSTTSRDSSLTIVNSLYSPRTCEGQLETGRGAIRIYPASAAAAAVLNSFC
jgi:hypothetical protein